MTHPLCACYEHRAFPGAGERCLECHSPHHRTVYHDVIRRQAYGPEEAHRYEGAKRRLAEFDSRA